MIFRDDDISPFTKMPEFIQVHQLFQKYGVKHTIAVICNGIKQHKELIEYINTNRPEFDVQIHCWDHTRFDEYFEIAEIMKCIKVIEKLFGERPTVLYPPWNITTDEVNDQCKELGLEVSTEKISLSQYVRTMGTCDEKIINFHYWADEIIMLEPALKLATGLIKPKPRE